MGIHPSNPLIVQSDRTLLLEVDHPLYPQVRDAIAPFAELVRSPEYIHTYRLTDLSLWNAAAAGLSAQQVLEVLQRYSKYPVPPNLLHDIPEIVSRFGRVRLEKEGNDLRLVCPDRLLLEELARHPVVRSYLGERLDAHSFCVPAAHRGLIKQALINVGYPAEDLAGYTPGAFLDVHLREICRSGVPFHLRAYQKEAAEIFYAGGDVRGGSGVIVLPCGAGKTIVGLAVMALLRCQTLVLTTSISAVKQWRRELLDKTNLTDEQIGEYTGESKQLAPVTLATYNILTYRPEKSEEFPHFRIFDQQDWGLIIYDEVHLLPAPVFRITAQIQARRRLGLTATLVREDGREADVFSLIGPKKYDVPWRELEAHGWIAEAQCCEIRLRLPEDLRMQYALAEPRHKYRLASENPAKLEVIARLLERHAHDQVLIIGQYLNQLRQIHQRFEIPLITGSTPTEERERLYDDFRHRRIHRLVLSKVGNFAIDLPDANVLIQVSGTFGSRQEEAQRLGRILRPKSDGTAARFYTLVTRDTREMEFAQHRQLFLTEQGYTYRIGDAEELLVGTPPSRRAVAP